MDEIAIDVEKLRNDLKNEAIGAFFGGGFDGALIEAGDVERALPEELIEMAERNGIDLMEYKI